MCVALEAAKDADIAEVLVMDLAHVLLVELLAQRGTILDFDFDARLAQAHAGVKAQVSRLRDDGASAVFKVIKDAEGKRLRCHF